MLCTRCKKRMAVVFISAMQGEEHKNEGLCLVCAKELGLPQVDEYIKQMGIDEDDIEMLSDQLMEITDGEAFELGGAETMPNFLQNIFGSDMLKSFSEKEKSQNEPPKRERKKKSSTKRDKKRKFLDQYCVDLTKSAREGELDSIIGRDKEIYRVTQILSRRTKNNPCLIGEPGVGKTAIAEGIAQKIVAGDVPFRLAEKELFLLDLTALVAGTQFRGQFESRVKGLIDEVKAAGNIILFIDEVHNLVGTGDSEGSMNAANILKPALSRGEVQVVGATTFTEYRKHIEKDSALERRFQPVTVTEPNIEETIEVLKGIKGYYEAHHKIKISDSIIASCASLSERYITDRFLPDKAIDLMDEAAACASIKSTELTEYEKLNAEYKKQLDEEKELEEASGEVDYERLAIVKSDVLKTKERLKELEQVVGDIEVTLEDVSKVIELWTGIPAIKIMETEFKKMGKLEDILKSKIIGQDEAVRLVSNAIKRSRVQLSKRRRPSSFIFVGPTGVGKTELVKVLANELFDTVDPLIRLDMSEFMEKHAVSRLIGSPPGYVGYDEAGQLTEKVRRKPYSVVLFDEIEKAHPDVMNILLQILDEGKVTDAQGRTVNFENTVIAMTSNAGSTDKNTGVG
ncbi:MAG: ATP-dependent Clp protease ATP-binding subunit, partial [Clostridiales bacterium]|nr:ATP-dependent Clp protease ATP-binding subunit [Clostridiales bacterium]